MIFDLTKNYVPESYVDSRDYRVFLRQLSSLITVFKYNIDHAINLYDPDECPDQLINLLGSMVGYLIVDTQEISISNKRKIIKDFPYAIQNRGGLLGIKLMIILCMNLCSTDSTTYFTDDDIDVNISDIEEGIIEINYPASIKDLVDWSLLEYVRPVGTSFIFTVSSIANSEESIEFRDKIHKYSHESKDPTIMDNTDTNFSTISPEQINE